MDDLIRGHFDECLQHLSARLMKHAASDFRGTAQMKKQIAKFCGVTGQAVANWLNGSLPVGETKIKLMFFLDLIGYRVIELERMPKGRRNFAELIGHGFLSVDKAVEILGYTKRSVLYEVLRGCYGASKEKDHKMWEAWKEKREELEKHKAEQRGVINHGTVSEPVAKASEIKTRIVSRKSPMAIFMEGLSVMFEETPPEEIPKKALARLSLDVVLRLQAHLGALGTKLVAKQERKETSNELSGCSGKSNFPG